MWYSFFNFLKDFYLFIFRERRREGEREVEKHQCVVASHMPPTGDLNAGVCPDWESNRQTFGSQDSTQSTEPHQPGLDVVFLTLGPRRGLGSLPALYKCTYHLCVCVYVSMYVTM